MIIGMVADIAYRMSILNPQLKEHAVRETPGIVLIDELDLHLHPKWQWKVVEDLKRTFPRIQFIATTHSPIVIASCKNGELINLGNQDNDETEKQSPYGWLIEDVLSLIMNTESRDKNIQDLISELQGLYRMKIESNLSEADIKRMKFLRNLISELLPESDPAVSLAQMDALFKKSKELVDDEKS